MRARLIDVVNWNADASCLGADTWLQALEGGRRSWFHRWLELYVERGRRVTLGIVGGTLADLAAYNPEALALVEDHPEVFESVLRPFSHDVGLLRSGQGFEVNRRAGTATARALLTRLEPLFLPPEFMLTSEQVTLLAAAGVRGVFVNPARFDPETEGRLPTRPYLVRGIDDATLACLPVAGRLTALYLQALQRLDAGPWSAAIRAAATGPPVIAWRDGESALLIPDGLERERRWLDGEADSIERVGVEEALSGPLVEPAPPLLRSYPVHSFHAWTKELRLLGYLTRLQALEGRAGAMTARQRALWFQAIGSDVLSAAEKRSPVVELAALDGGPPAAYTIWRCERTLEGEEALVELESPSAVERDPRVSHRRKLAARIRMLEQVAS